MQHHKVYNHLQKTVSADPSTKDVADKAMVLIDKQIVKDLEEAKAQVANHETTVQGMITALEELTCNFCQGWGHRAKKCSTLKSMNKRVADCPGLKGAWGKLKSKYLDSAHEVIAVEATVERAAVKGKILGKRGYQKRAS